MPGMVLHQDASTHAWVPGVTWDLVVTMDKVRHDTALDYLTISFVDGIEANSIYERGF